MKLWRVDKMFRLNVLSATYVNVKDVDLIYIRTGLFHGTEPLCPVRETKYVSPLHPRWDEWLDFDLYIPDLPRSAKLCISICSVKKTKKREENTMLCWGNVSLFDYRHRLLTEKVSLNLWGVPRGMDELLNPLGSTGSNPIRDSPCLELQFDRHESPAVVYPNIDDFREYANFIQNLPAGRNVNISPAQTTMSNEELQQLEDIKRRDPLAEISEQEKEMLWRLRTQCLKIPDILPRLLDAVKWNSRDEITQLYLLLQDWPPVSAQTALELLDCKYADMMVREKAVGWLNDKMTDEDLAQYLLQLVQTLKYEPYLNSPLSHLLLRRALLNRKIGHFFFWHLKSELQTQALIVRFGLLLEGFCRGLGPYLKDLNKQVEANDKLTKLTDSIKERYQDTIKDRLKYLYEQMSQADYAESLQFFSSPLENTVVLGELKTDQCRVMDSAKKPLWLVWKNPDPLADDLHQWHAVIFKNGDDLRQDMLTLQVRRFIFSSMKLPLTKIITEYFVILRFISGDSHHGSYLAY